jgi:hypothetical protein
VMSASRSGRRTARASPTFPMSPASTPCTSIRSPARAK